MACAYAVNPFEPFIILLIAHLIGDFVLQTEQMALKKGHVFRWLMLHALELGLITWLLCWSVAALPVVAVVFLTHLTFDWIKPRLKGHPILWYGVDQFAHLLTLWLCALWMVNHLALGQMPLSAWLPWDIQVLVAAYLLVGRPLTIGMGLFLKPWQDEMIKANGNGGAEGSLTGLTRSSEWIGNIERFFVLTVVLAGQFVLVAGLLVAKFLIRAFEITRGGEIRKRADYIIIGTLGSVTLAVVVGLLARMLLSFD